ncbi:Mnd1 [Kluyveromyces lactis]|nr:Mnd1 [Kluyveromyces lactis]
MAPGKNTVSLAEKKARILRFFQEEHTVYNMKELEKYIPKKCGISSMLVKELVQKMIDEDGLISVEKCGNINVYWSFKNQMQNKLNSDASNIEKRIEHEKSEIARCQELYQMEIQGQRSDTLKNRRGWKRSAQLSKLKEVQKTIRGLNSKYDELSKNNWTPQRIKQEKHNLFEKASFAVGLADNIDCIAGYISSTYCVQMSDLKVELELPNEFNQFETILEKLGHL